MKRIPLLALALTLLLAWSTPLPVGAASKYKACSLLTAAELGAALGAKVDRSVERDIVIDEGPYKGETMSSCDWVIGGATHVSLSVIRQVLSGEQRAAGLAKLRQALEDLKKQGWTVESANIAGAACSTARPPASESSALPLVGCFMESKGFAFSVYVVTRATVTPQQVKALADKAAARLP